MAIIGSDALTLVDWSKRLDPDGKIADISEVLTEQNEMLEDAVFVESNGPTSHRTTIRTGLPQGVWRALYEGVPTGKSTTVQVQEALGMLEIYSKVDMDLINMSSDKERFRLSEEVAFMEGLNQQMQDQFIYGNTAAEPRGFNGIAQRYSSLSAQNADNVLNAAGDSNRTSVWLVGWGYAGTQGLFPQNKIPGLQHRNLGEHTVLDENGNEYQAMRSHYKWDAGVTVRDWKKNVRICNIDTAALELVPDSGADLVKLMIEASERIYTAGVRPVWYCNRTIRTWLRLQMLNHKNTNVSFETVEGKRVMMFDDYPIKLCDALINTETAVA